MVIVRRRDGGVGNPDATLRQDIRDFSARNTAAICQSRLHKKRRVVAFQE